MKRLLFALAGLLILGFVLIAFVLPYFDQSLRAGAVCQSIRAIVVAEGEAEPYVTEADVAEVLERSGVQVVGLPADSVDLLAVRRVLEEAHLFSSIEPYLSSRGRELVVKVQLYEPEVLVYSSQEGQKSPYYVCRGREIVPLNPRYPIYVPVATGDISLSFACDTLAPLVRMVQADAYHRDSFGQYAVEAERGIVLTSRLSDARIYMGRGGDWQDKLHRLRLFQEEVLPRRGANAYDYIDLRFEGQVVAAPMP